jgi:hypothetical protein
MNAAALQLGDDPVDGGGLILDGQSGDGTGAHHGGEVVQHRPHEGHLDALYLLDDSSWPQQLAILVDVGTDHRKVGPGPWVFQEGPLGMVAAIQEPL